VVDVRVRKRQNEIKEKGKGDDRENDDQGWTEDGDQENPDLCFLAEKVFSHGLTQIYTNYFPDTRTTSILACVHLRESVA
jgi:hypothetical protein